MNEDTLAGTGEEWFFQDWGFRMDMLDGETKVRDYNLERLIMLSDGVFAIALTLLAFDLRPSGQWPHDLDGLANALAAPFQAFFWSFFSTGTFWIYHRRIFSVYTRADGPVSVLNLILLGEITLIPAATKILVDLGSSTLSLDVYLGLFGLIGITNAVNWCYATTLGGIVTGEPRAGRIVSVAILLAFLPVSMCALGVLSGQPGLSWLPLFIPVLSAVAILLRRAGDVFDKRYAKADGAHAGRTSAPPTGTLPT